MLELTEFGGEIKNWWQQTSIDGDKFQYLLQATTPNSRGRESISSYPPIGNNYTKARFGHDDLIIDYYVRKLLLKLTVTINSSQSKWSISTLYNNLETQLQSLETWDIASEKYAAILFPLDKSCLWRSSESMAKE